MKDVVNYLKRQTEYIVQRVDKLVGDCDQVRHDCRVHHSGRRDAIRKEFRWIIAFLIGILGAMFAYAYTKVDTIEKRLINLTYQISKQSTHQNGQTVRQGKGKEQHGAPKNNTNSRR